MAFQKLEEKVNNITEKLVAMEEGREKERGVREEGLEKNMREEKAEKEKKVGNEEEKRRMEQEKE